PGCRWAQRWWVGLPRPRPSCPSPGRLAHRLPFARRRRVAGGDIGMGGIGADARQDLPRARAFPAGGEPYLDRDAFDVVETERVGRALALDQRRRRGDGTPARMAITHVANKAPSEEATDRPPLNHEAAP